MKTASRSFRRGFTFVELLVVAGLLSLGLAIGVVHFRNSRTTMGSMAAQIDFRMDLRQATDLLTDLILNGTELVKPLSGGSASYLVIKDIRNFLQAFYLREAQAPENKPYELVTYVDKLTGTNSMENFRVLAGNVQSITFTNISPGMVVVSLVMVDRIGKELGSMIQVPLKNLGAVEE